MTDTALRSDENFDLLCVAQWLETGCDPQKAAGELRLYMPKLASLRERLEKAEEKSSAWHRLALDVGVERDEAQARALAAESKLAEAKGALEWIAGMAEARAADDKQVFTRVNRGALRNIAARARSLETQEKRHDG